MTNLWTFEYENLFTRVETTHALGLHVFCQPSYRSMRQIVGAMCSNITGFGSTSVILTINIMAVPAFDKKNGCLFNSKFEIGIYVLLTIIWKNLHRLYHIRDNRAINFSLYKHDSILG